MIENQEAIEILEDIERKLNYKEWKLAKKDIEYYIKNLEITENEKINNLIKRYKKIRKLYGENSYKTKILAKKIDKKLLEIYNKKI